MSGRPRIVVQRIDERIDETDSPVITRVLPIARRGMHLKVRRTDVFLEVRLRGVHAVRARSPSRFTDIIALMHHTLTVLQTACERRAGPARLWGLELGGLQLLVHSDKITYMQAEHNAEMQKLCSDICNILNPAMRQREYAGSSIARRSGSPLVATQPWHQCSKSSIPPR